MKITIGSVGHTYGTIEWDGSQYRVTGEDRFLLSKWIPDLEERLGLSGPAFLEALVPYFAGGGADKWVKLER